MTIRDGWFEEQEDGTRDYIAILENGEVLRFVNIYPVAMHFDDIPLSSELATITMDVKYSRS